MHPVTFNKNGDVYTLSFEGFVDKVCIPSDRPKRLGKPITLYVDGIKPITYETMTKAAKELGISVQTLRYHCCKSNGKNSATFYSNGNCYRIYPN